MWLIADNAGAYVASAFWPKEAEMAGDNYYYASTLVLMIHWLFNIQHLSIIICIAVCNLR